MKVYISGGCKNGKSTAAEDLAIRLSGDHKRYYVATMIPYDDEDHKRVEKHVNNRAGKGFETIECGRGIEKIISEDSKKATYLIDSVTALLLNEMFTEDYNGEADPEAAKRCKKGLKAVGDQAGNVVYVSDYIYSDAVRYDEFTENYRRMLAEVDCFMAAECDAVLEYVSGIAVFHKGKGLL